MKKSSNDIVRSLFLMAAMIIIGAGSAFAQSESDYFSLTKNVGTESESTSYYTTFAGAVGDAANGDKITLLKDYTAPDEVSITKSITLDLNDHTISFNFDDNLITVKIGAMLTVINTDTYTDKKGTLTAGDDYGRSPINVNTGGTLHVTGVSIDGRDHPGIYIDGTAEIDDCDLGGACGFESNGTTYVTKSNLSGRNYGIWVVGGTTTIGEDVYIPYFGCYGICYNDGAIILNALPTFTERPTTRATTRATTRDAEIYDIAIACGLSLTFGQVSIKKPEQKISLSINGTGVDPATYTKAIATNYEAAFTDNGIMIDPNDVFRWYYDNNPDGFRTDATGAMVFGAVKASVSTYNAGNAPTIENYTTLADALAAAQEGYVAGNGGDVEEFIPTVTLLADIDAKETCFAIGDGSTTKKVKLDLNDKTIMRPQLDNKLFFVSTGATLELINTDSDPNPEKTGTITREEDWGGSAIAVASGGELIATGVTIEGGSTGIYIEGTAVIDDCKIRGKYAIRDYGTVTVTNSDIIGGDGSSIQVGEEVRDNNGEIQVYDGRLTIGKEVYISGGYPAIDYYAGTVILKALPTFGTERPKTSSTTRAKTRDYFYYDIGIKSGLSFIFEEGTFKTPDQTISIYITDNNGPVDPATYTNAITTNYSDYVIDGGEVIDPNKVFRWAAEFTRGFRLDTAGEVIFDHAAATVTSYSGTSTPTTTPYYDFSEAIAAANSGYKTASEAGGTEFIPTLKMLDDVSIDTGVEIGDGETTTKVTLDLNDHELKGNCDAGTIIVKGKATLSLVDTGTDPNKKGTIVCSDGYAIRNEGTADINGCNLSAKYGIYSNNTATVANCAISATTYGIYEDNGTTTVGEGVSFSGNREANIYKHLGTLTLTAWPTFGGSETEGYADIKLSSGRAVNFRGIGLGAPMQDATLCMNGSSDSESATLTFTPNTGYALIVDYNNTVITPENGAYTFTMPDADVTITATWKIQTEISLDEPPSGYIFYVLDEVGTGATLTDVVSSTAVTDENVTLTYTSSNESVAKVVNGKIQALAAGTATITVSFAGNDKYAAAESKTITVTVTLNESSVSVNDLPPDGSCLYVDDTFALIPTTTPEGLDVTYIPDNSGVVSVDENGVITALKEGTASVTVKVGGDGVYALSSSTVTFTVSKVPTVITVEKATLELKVNDEVPTGASLTPAEAGSLTYTSSNEKVAKVVNGKIQALAEGTATITVSFAGDDKYAAAESKTIDLTIVYPTMTVTLPAGLSTYYDNVGVRVSDSQAEGVKIYAVTAVNGDQVTLKQLPSRTIPANTPVIIGNTGSEALDCQFEYAANSAGKAQFASTLASDLGVANAEAISSTLSSSFVGTAENIDAYEPANGATLYGLNGKAFVKLDAKPNIPANRCWLEIPGIASAGTRTLTIVFGDGDTTSLDAAKRQTEEGTANWYSLDGRKLDGTPKAKGLYIMNGKKVIIKK